MNKNLLTTNKTPVGVPPQNPTVSTLYRIIVLWEHCAMTGILLPED